MKDISHRFASYLLRCCHQRFEYKFSVATGTYHFLGDLRYCAFGGLSFCISCSPPTKSRLFSNFFTLTLIKVLKKSAGFPSRAVCGSWCWSTEVSDTPTSSPLLHLTLRTFEKASVSCTDTVLLHAVIWTNFWRRVTSSSETQRRSALWRRTTEIFAENR